MARTLILVADDNADTRNIVRLALEHRGYDVTTALDGEEAIEQAREKHPDLILMDLQMPHVSGFDAARALKADESTALIPIVAMTAANLGAEVREYGFCAILLKPILPTQLANAVERCRTATKAGREWIDFAGSG